MLSYTESPNSPQDDIWEYLDRLIATSRVVIDRPKGSAHPRFPEMIYPLDYGYLDGTTTVDGAGIDLWRGLDPSGKLDAIALTVDLKKRDAELKLFLGCSEEEKKMVLEFLNQNPMCATLIPRQAPTSLTAQGLRCLLETRHSVRHFAEHPISQDTLETVVRMATLAPSAHHRQPWRFAIVVSPEVKIRLAETMAEAFRKDQQADGLSDETIETQISRSRQRIQQAPAAIIISLDRDTLDTYPDARRNQIEYLMAAQGVAMAGENLLLAAHALGFGAVWMCAPLFAGEVVRQTLDLPSSWDPQGLVLMGTPATPLQERRQKPMENILRFIDS